MPPPPAQRAAATARGALDGGAPGKRGSAASLVGLWKPSHGSGTQMPEPGRGHSGGMPPLHATCRPHGGGSRGLPISTRCTEVRPAQCLDGRPMLHAKGGPPRRKERAQSKHGVRRGGAAGAMAPQGPPGRSAHALQRSCRAAGAELCSGNVSGWAKMQWAQSDPAMLHGIPMPPPPGTPSPRVGSGRHQPLLSRFVSGALPAALPPPVG